MTTDFSASDEFDPDAMSEFQMEHFVLRQHGVTPYGMWKQAFREANARAARLDSDQKAGVKSPPRILEELLFFKQRRYELEADLREKHGSLVGDVREMLEAEFFCERLVRSAEIDLCCFGRLSPAVVEAMGALPKAKADAVWTRVNQAQGRAPERLGRVAAELPGPRG